MTEAYETTSICDECRGTQFILFRKCADVVCIKCGAILISKVMDASPEWRTQTENGINFDSIRAEAEDILGISEIVDSNATPEQRRVLNEMRKLTMNPADRAILKSVHYVRDLSIILGVSNRVRDESIRLFCRVVRSGIQEYKNKKTLAASCLYINSKYLGCARTVDEVSTLFDIDKSIISRVVGVITQRLELSPIVINAQDLLIRYIQAAGASLQILSECEAICESIAAISQLDNVLPQTIAVIAVIITSTLRNETLRVEPLFRLAYIDQNPVKRAFVVVKACIDEILPQRYLEDNDIKSESIQNLERVFNQKQLSEFVANDSSIDFDNDNISTKSPIKSNEGSNAKRKLSPTNEQLYSLQSSKLQKTNM